MGLGLSTPFKDDETLDNQQETPNKLKEIGICQLMDPRSPTNAYERTPIYYKPSRETIRQENAVVVIPDPRSPTDGITRTPLAALDEERLPNNEIVSLSEVNELRAQIERLKLFDTPPNSQRSNSFDTLASDKDIIKPRKGILKLLEDAAATPIPAESFDSQLTLPNTPPCPQSESTPKEIPSPDTPAVQQTELNKLLKKKKSHHTSKRTRRQGQQSSKLKKTVLTKKSGINGNNGCTQATAPRSPLTERNIDVGTKTYIGSKKTSKAPGMMKYKRYNTLDESFTELFPGKENEEIAW